MKRWINLIPLAPILLLGSACQPTATPEAVPHNPGTPALEDQAVLETKVAATLTALAPAASPTAAMPEPATATATPAISPTPESGIAPSPTDAVRPAQVVYAKEDVVYLWQDGTARSLTNPGSAVFDVILSDDGQWLAYTRQVDDLRQEIWAVRTDSAAKDGTLLVSNADFAAIDPTALAVLPYKIDWVPGSHILAFNTHQVFEGPGVAPYDDLHLINVDTFERRTPFLAGEGGDFYFSPDGMQVALSTPTQVDLANLDGSNRRNAVLTFEMVLTFSEYMLYPELAWAPDSSAVWAAIPPHDALAQPAQPSTLWSIPADGSPATRLAEFYTAPILGFDLPISAQAGRVAYMAEIGEQPNAQIELHLLGLDGSADETIHTAAYIRFLGWSPGGQRYAASVGNSQAFYLGEVGGSFVPAPGAPAGVSSLKWLDEERYIYVQTSDSGATLFSGSLSAAPLAIDQVNEGFISYSVP